MSLRFCRTFAIFVFIVFFTYFITPSIARAQFDWSTFALDKQAEDQGAPTEYACAGLTVIGDETVSIATIKGFECLLRNVLATATTFVGLASFVMIIIGAFLYLTSGGNTKGTEAAKQTITYAIIGIVISLMAFFILNFVAIFTGVRGILQFNLNIGN